MAKRNDPSERPQTLLGILGNVDSRATNRSPGMSRRFEASHRSPPGGQQPAADRQAGEDVSRSARSSSSVGIRQACAKRSASWSGVGAGQDAGEGVARVQRHPDDVALARMAVGEPLDVRREPEAAAACSRDATTAVGDRDRSHTSYRRWAAKFTPRARIEKKISTWLSHEACLGVN